MSMARSILLVDDDSGIRNMLKATLSQQGFRVLTAVNGRDALFTAREEDPDLIILDVMMPEMGGYEFMHVYGRDSDTPVIMLTAKVDEADKVLGLELGADDYVTKPFSIRELIARVNAMLRRVDKLSGGGSSPTPMIRVDDIALDVDGRVVLVDGERIGLTRSEFEILKALMDAPNRVYSRLDLMEKCQESSFDGYDRSIDVHIHNLRMKIESDPSQSRHIETVYGMGYRFVQG